MKRSASVSVLFLLFWCIGIGIAVVSNAISLDTLMLGFSIIMSAEYIGSELTRKKGE